jgi:hypothetical protein
MTAKRDVLAATAALGTVTAANMAAATAAPEKLNVSPPATIAKLPRSKREIVAV